MTGAFSARLTTWLGGKGAAALLGVCLGVAVMAGNAEADKVGVAAAVNPDAFSSLEGAPKSQLNIGKSIFYNERINTTGSGLVQVLLIDGSTFTVGPGSDLVIDKFVYDPSKKTGEMVATFSKGVMRFVGGRLSKNPDAVTINTAAGALAIRGGMFMAQVNGPKSATFSFLFGVQMTLGAKFTVFQPGNSIYVTKDGTTIGPTTQAVINAMMAALSKGGANGGTDGPGKPPSQLVNTLSLQNLIANATQDRLNNNLHQDETDDPAPGDPPSLKTADNTPPSGPTDPPGGPTDPPGGPNDPPGGPTGPPGGPSEILLTTAGRPPTMAGRHLTTLQLCLMLAVEHPEAMPRDSSATTRERIRRLSAHSVEFPSTGAICRLG